MHKLEDRNQELWILVPPKTCPLSAKWLKVTSSFLMGKFYCNFLFHMWPPWESNPKLWIVLMAILIQARSSIKHECDWSAAGLDQSSRWFVIFFQQVLTDQMIKCGGQLEPCQDLFHQKNEWLFLFFRFRSTFSIVVLLYNVDPMQPWAIMELILILQI